MKTVIISPHTDDAIFSLGDYMQGLENVTILTVFPAIPPMSLDNGVGYKKHTLLRAEHDKACEVMGVKQINLDFLDDVYEPRPTMEELCEALIPVLSKFDNVIAPIGIHHPDHVLLRETLFRMAIAVDYWYMDLPYGVLYRPLKEEILKDRAFSMSIKINRFTEKKERAVNCYQSQLQSDHIRGQIFVDEEVYRA